MEKPAASRRLGVGWLIVFAIGIAFMAIALYIAATPLPLEEGYAGTTFANLQRTNPQLANVIWHDYVAFGLLLLGVSVLTVVLSWKGLSQGSPLAWYSLLIIGVTIAVMLVLAHVPVGYDFSHYGVALVLDAILLIGLAISAKPVFTK